MKATGRVYCWCDATSGSIKPGDLLTISDIPGHAMKVTDHDKASGTILGKEMSKLVLFFAIVLQLFILDPRSVSADPLGNWNITMKKSN